MPIQSQLLPLRSRSNPVQGRTRRRIANRLENRSVRALDAYRNGRSAPGRTAGHHARAGTENATLITYVNVGR